MKRILSFIICILIALSLFACKNKPQDKDPYISAAGSEKEDSKSTITDDTADGPENNVTENGNDKPTEPSQATNSSEADGGAESPENNVAENGYDNTSEPSQVTDSTEVTDSVDKPTDKETGSSGDKKVDRSSLPAIAEIKDIDGSFTDIFVAKIIGVEKEVLPRYPDLMTFPSDRKSTVYIAEVESVIWTLCVTEKMVIRVVRKHSDPKSMFWSDPYEIGKSYIVSGVVQPVDDDTIIVDSNSLTSEVKENGDIKPISEAAEYLFADIKTLKEFVTHPDMVRIAKTEPPIPTTYAKPYNVINYSSHITEDELDEKGREENNRNKADLIADLRKALIVDSDFKMNLERKDEVK